LRDRVGKATRLRERRPKASETNSRAARKKESAAAVPATAES